LKPLQCYYYPFGCRLGLENILEVNNEDFLLLSEYLFFVTTNYSVIVIVVIVVANKQHWRDFIKLFLFFVQEIRHLFIQFLFYQYRLNTMKLVKWIHLVDLRSQTLLVSDLIWLVIIYNMVSFTKIFIIKTKDSTTNLANCTSLIFR